jgi:hypothetical protein
VVDVADCDTDFSDVIDCLMEPTLSIPFSVDFSRKSTRYDIISRNYMIRISFICYHFRNFGMQSTKQ